VLSHLPPVRVVAGSSTLARVLFVVGVLVAATPLMLAATTVVFWVATVANIASYAALMQGIYPDRERAEAMGRVRVGAAVAGMVSTIVAGALIDAVPAGAVFAVAALISLPGSLAFFRIRHEPAAHGEHRRPVREVARDVWSDRRYRRLLLSFLVFGWGNLMAAAVYPLVLVDRFDASNTFVGVLATVQSATMILAYPLAGRLIDRGSSLRQTYIATLLTILIPAGYAVSPAVWGLLPVSVIAGVTIASSELTFYTNLVQMAPRGRVAEYAAAQSLLLGARGTLAPFAASALLAVVLPRGVLFVAVAFMVVGSMLMGAAVREPRAVAQGGARAHVARYRRSGTPRARIAAANRSAMRRYPSSEGWKPSPDTVMAETSGALPVKRSTRNARSGCAATTDAIASLYARMSAASWVLSASA